MNRYRLSLYAMMIAFILAGDCSARDKPTDKARLSAVRLLRRASEITLNRRRQQPQGTSSALLEIAMVQIRAHDFDGAERSAQASTDGGRRRVVRELAEVLASRGDLDRALSLLESVKEDDDYQKDRVTLLWIEHLIDTAAFDESLKAIPKIQSETTQIDAMIKLAIVSSRTDEATRTSSFFELAAEMADGLESQFERIESLSKLGLALVAIENFDAVRTIIDTLTAERYDELENQVYALQVAAMLESRANNPDASRRLFRQAHERIQFFEKHERAWFLARNGKEQADAGDFQGALETIAVFQQDAPNPASESRALDIRNAIVVERLKRDQVDEAIQTVSMMSDLLLYREAALQEIIKHQVRRGDLADALDMTNRLNNPAKAVEVLKIAALYARSGDHDRAREIASRIELAFHHRRAPGWSEINFDYRSPRTWGIYRTGSASWPIEHSRVQSAKVAATAMLLAHALGELPSEPPEELFSERQDEQVIRVIARMEVRLRKSERVPGWVRRIGEGHPVEAKRDLETVPAVPHRIYALIGAAEGLLDIADGTVADTLP